jgi:hypothetical protein
MADANQTQPAAKAMTAADAARLVKRKLVERKPVMKGGEQVRDKDGTAQFEEVTREVTIGASEVLAFKDYGTHVVVVTKDGKKFSSAADE